MAKLPKDVLILMTDQKNDGDEWAVQLLTDPLHRYVCHRENEDRQTSYKVDYIQRLRCKHVVYIKGQPV